MINSGALYARLLTHELGIDSIPVSLKSIINKLDILFDEVDTKGDFEGCFLTENGSKCILIDKNIISMTRRRFTIGHELGHATIPHHNKKKYECSIDNAFFNKNINDEKEANDFAAELLMPETFLSEVSSKNGISFDVIKKISKECETSLLSSAFQSAKYSPDKVVCVISQNSKVKCSFASEEMKDSRLFIFPKTTLSRDSLANDYFNQDGTVKNNEERSEEIYARAWFDVDNDRYNCIEHIIAIPSYNYVLSLICLSEQIDDNDDW